MYVFFLISCLNLTICNIAIWKLYVVVEECMNKRKSELKIIGNLKNEKATGADMITGQMLRYGGETVMK